jgi:hypothetical protein
VNARDFMRGSALLDVNRLIELFRALGVVPAARRRPVAA